MRRLAILIGLSFLCSTSSAQPWETVGGEAFVAVAGLSDGALVMVREPGDILRSSDRGATWHRVYHGLTSLTGIERAGDTAFAFYDSVAVLVSHDTGRTWRGVDAGSGQARKPRHYSSGWVSQPPLPSAKGDTILATATVDSVCYAVGAPGLVYVSDASKQHWRRLHRAPFSSAGASASAPGSARSTRLVDFYTAASGAILRDSLLYVTHDSGTTWQEVRTGLRVASAMLMLSDTSALVGDTSGSLALVRSDSTHRLDSMLGAKRPIIQIGWRNKPNGDIYILTDSAMYLTTTSFESVTSRALPLRAGEHATSASYPDPYTCYVIADSITRLDTTTLTDNITHDTTIYHDTSTVYLTTDGGATWATTTSGLVNLKKIFFASSKSGYACGPHGALMFTADSSLTWHRSFVPRAQDLHDVRFVNDSAGYAVGDSGMVFMTQNRGRWWRMVAPEPLFSHPGSSYQSIAFADARTVYVLGSDRCYRQTIRDPMAGFRFTRRTQQKNTLAVTASPNPSNGFVRFTITSKQTADDGSSPTLVISDASGRTVEQLQDVSAGAMNTWSATADFSNLTTGPYTAIATLGGASGLCKFAIAH